MISRLRTLLLLLCFCAMRKYGCSRVMMIATPEEEEVELERELQSLNKPPVKTIQLEEGEIIDCVDIHKQPALDNHLLKNHKIQLRPTSFPAEIQKPVPVRDPVSETWSKMEACPDGTVPIHRTTKNDLLRAKRLAHQMFGNIGNPNALAPNSHQVFVRINQTDQITYHGVVGSTSIYKPVLSSPDWSSTSNVWVEGPPPAGTTLLIAGWMVSRSINGDDKTRLFVYWTADGDKTGCFDFLCKGFVQIHKTVAPKTLVEPVSKFGGATYDIKLAIYQDPIARNWWLLAGENNISVGYWPKEIVPGLVNGAGDVGWGGIAMAKKNEDSPPMGSGQLPDGFYDHAAYFRNIHYMVAGLQQIVPSDSDPVFEFVGGVGCYGLQNDKDTKQQFWGYRFSFGGPGGACGK